MSITADAAGLTATVLEGFHDERLQGDAWETLHAKGPTQVVFLTKEWQQAWWESLGSGELLLILAEQDGRPVALAPLFVVGKMGFFVGSGGSDYLDFLGDIGCDGVLDAFIAAALEADPDLIGFRFHHVRDDSITAKVLPAACEGRGLRLFDEGDLGAPGLRLSSSGEEALQAANKKSLRRHENYFRRNGELSVMQTDRGEEIAPELDAFFEQHIRRWAGTEYPSLFLEEQQRRFYERLTDLAGREGWLRFTKVEWNGKLVAAHLGFSYAGRYLWYKPTFDVDLARRSPGEVLLRQLLLEAADEKVDLFDLGLGEEPFKERFSDHVASVRTWGAYKLDVLRVAGREQGE